MKGIYLGAFKAFHPGFNLIYQDINGLRDIPGNMLDIDLSLYDFIIATPPCNFWSRANYRRYVSEYSCSTSYLLPSILDKLILLNKPFIVENVRNSSMFSLYGLLSKKCYFYFIKRHTYWTNFEIKSEDLEKLNFMIDNYYKTIHFDKRQGFIQNNSSGNRQGGEEVHLVIDFLLEKYICL